MKKKKKPIRQVKEEEPIDMTWMYPKKKRREEPIDMTWMPLKKRPETNVEINTNLFYKEVRKAERAGDRALAERVREKFINFETPFERWDPPGLLEAAKRPNWKFKNVDMEKCMRLFIVKYQRIFNLRADDDE